MALFKPNPDRESVEELIESLSQELASRYAGAEDELIREVAARAYRDLELSQLPETAPGGMGLTAAARRRQNQVLAQLAIHRANAIRDLQVKATQIVERLRSEEWARRIINLAATEGEAAAVAQLGLAGRVPTNVVPLPFIGSATAISATTLTGTATQAVGALVFSLESRLEALNQRITRYPQDAYQRIVSMHTPSTLLGVTTSRVQQAATVRNFLSEGITGFVDRADRRWTIGAYAEMAGRTSVNRAFNDAGAWRMGQAGIHLVTVVRGLDSCENCAAWAGKILSTDGRPAGVIELPHTTTKSTVTITVAGTVNDARNAGWNHPNCFPGFVPVSAPTGVSAADSRWFEGEVVVIHTAAGRELTVTPNHPILTTEGWVKAGELVEGHDLISYSGDVQKPLTSRPDHEGVETPIGEVYETLRQSGHVTPVRVPGTAEDFHGDGTADAEVEIVLAHGLLGSDGQATRLNLSPESDLILSRVRQAELLRVGAALQIFHAAGHPSDGVMGGGGNPGALFGAGLSHAGEHRLGTVALGDSALPESSGDDITGYAETISDRLDGLSSLVSGHDLGGVDLAPTSDLDPSGFESSGDHAYGDTVSASEFVTALSGLVSTAQTVNVERRHFAGHVYNLQTAGGWYTANSIVVHNCRCRLVAYLPGLTTQQNDTTYDPEAERERARQRELERNIRAAKRREAYSDPGDRMAQHRAHREVLDSQAAMREFLADTGRNRSSYREALGFADGR